MTAGMVSSVHGNGVVFPDNDEGCAKQPAFNIPFNNAVLQKYLKVSLHVPFHKRVSGNA
jgi:hypothetical protein